MGKLPVRLKRIIFITALILLVFLLSIFLGEIIFQSFYPFPQKIKYGVTFSPKFAQSLGMDWQDSYIKILDDMKVKNLRIPTYWDEIEKIQRDYDFQKIDFMLDEARKRNVKVILVLGVRQPRWPECHLPDWAKKLSVEDRQNKTLEFIGRVVERYKTNTAMLAWQVENEPLLSSFGEGCDRPDKNFLKAEVELVKKLNGKPIMVTDSGELGSWITPMKLSDIFGTTLYRKVYDQTFGYVTYPYLPYLYNLKATAVRGLFAPQNKKTIISELQAEPWLVKNGQVIFSIEDFKKNINFAKQTGFDTAYLWGVEWWYFMEKMGHPQYLEYAKTLFK